MRKVKKPESKAVMYIGPRFGMLRPGMVFVTLPEFLQQYIRQCPEMRDLLPLIADSSKAITEVNTRCSARWYSARKVLNVLAR